MIGSDSGLRRVGYWAEEPSPGGATFTDTFSRWVSSLLKTELPRASDHVDASWDPSERRRVVEYLQRGLVHGAEYGFSLCRICGRENGSQERTDMVYLWPEGFAHYVRDHGVKPPEDFVRHVLQRSGSATQARPPGTTP